MGIKYYVLSNHLGQLAANLIEVSLAACPSFAPSLGELVAPRPLHLHERGENQLRLCTLCSGSYTAMRAEALQERKDARV